MRKKEMKERIRTLEIIANNNHNVISNLERIVERLREIHRVGGKDFFKIEHNPNQIMVNLDEIDGLVSVQEVLELLVNNKPIERKEEIDVKYMLDK